MRSSAPVGCLMLGLAFALGILLALALPDSIDGREPARPVITPVTAMRDVAAALNVPMPSAIPTAAARVQPEPVPVVVSKATPEPRQRPRNGLSGRASWFAAPGGTAAAGPALRAMLGKGWRGSLVTVTAGGRSVRVRVSDWCLCRDRHGVPTVIDLADDDFARLAPLSRGVVAVTVGRP